MGKSRTLATYVDEAGQRTSEPTASGPFVGIWWADKNTLAAFLQLAANVRSKAQLLPDATSDINALAEATKKLADEEAKREELASKCTCRTRRTRSWDRRCRLPNGDSGNYLKPCR